MATTEKAPLSRETAAFLDSHHRLLIGGEWVDAEGGKTIDVFNPATEGLIAKAPAASAGDIDSAVRAARRAFESGPWPAMTPTMRSEHLWRLSDLVAAHERQLTELEIIDNGMPVAAAALAVPYVVKVLRYYAGWPTKIAGLAMPSDRVAHAGSPGVNYTRREPVGVVGQIIPWNYPLAMAAMKLGPALATGCTVVLKPAELTPMSALYLARLIAESDLPPGVVNVVPGFGETAGAALAAHPGVDKIAFTGSTEVGKKIIQASTGNLKRVSLELGGKSPLIVFPDADLDAATGAAARFAFFLQGQNCMCASRVFVHERIYERVLSGMIKTAREMKIGPGWEPDTRLGPLISANQLRRVSGYVDKGTSEGAELLTGGKRIERRGHFFEPTIFARTRPDMTIVREEIFGPVTCVEPFSGDDLDEVARQANDTSYGLVASVWTRDLKIAHTLAEKIRAGVVGINHHGGADITAPFGGFKQSGWGREGGAESLDHYLESKTVVTRY